MIGLFVAVVILGKLGVMASHYELLTIDPAITQIANTFMNCVMLIYVARLDARVTPRVKHIEREVDSRQAGGSRHYDPPQTDGDAERT